MSLDAMTVYALSEALRDEALEHSGMEAERINWCANFIEEMVAEDRQLCPRCEVEHRVADFMGTVCGWCAEDLNREADDTRE